MVPHSSTALSNTTPLENIYRHGDMVRAFSPRLSEATGSEAENQSEWI